MAKRFTDSEKWRKPWFRGLPRDAKLAWTYLTDNCDHAGIWPAAFDLMTSDLGFEISAEVLRDWFGDKIIQLSPEKFFLPGYIQFQYGELKEESKPHLSVIKILIKEGIDPQKLTVSKGYGSSFQTTKDKDKEKAKDKNKEKEKGDARGGEIPSSSDDLLKITSPEILKLYADSPDYTAREAVKAWAWVENNSHKAPRTMRGFRQFFSGWLERGWDEHRKKLPSNVNTQSSTPGDWESLAAQALNAILKHGSGSRSSELQRADMGDELYRLACRAGIQRIRETKRDAFQLRNIADMLKRAAEAGAA